MLYCIIEREERGERERERERERESMSRMAQVFFVGCVSAAVGSVYYVHYTQGKKSTNIVRTK